MNLLSFLSFTIVAAEQILSPIPKEYEPLPVVPPKPAISFSQLAIPDVLGVQTELEETPLTTPTPTSVPTKKTKKQTVIIALLGDSMMDTLGPNAPHVIGALKKIYPGTQFIIKNFGVGGKPITDGIARITSGYTYLDKAYPSLISEQPDVVILESFGYNPTGDDQGAIDNHWLQLAKAVDTLKSQLPHARIVIGATIAPNSSRFGDGAPGIAFSPEDKQRRTTVIKNYLENAIKFAQSQHLPLADAYHASLDGSGNGKLAYINAGDHIHYSDAGRKLFATKIAEIISAKKLLE